MGQDQLSDLSIILIEHKREHRNTYLLRDIIKIITARNLVISVLNL